MYVCLDQGCSVRSLAKRLPVCLRVMTKAPQKFRFADFHGF